MAHTRRGFVGTAAALGALAGTGVTLRPAWAQAGPVRSTLGEFAKDEKKLASLRRGVAVMKARAPSDHRSWFWQAATHAYNDALYADALKQDRAVAQVDSKRYWNRCPHFGQCSADFLIWHRAFLANFELVLRDAAQDADLALPYWDYTSVEGRDFPAAFLPEFLDGKRRIPNPLFHPTRNYDFINDETQLSDPVVVAFDTVHAPAFFSDVGVTGFAGDFADAGRPVSGLIETRPHGDIHMVVGGYITGINTNGAMSDIPTAAFDPVFWVHHANIDRMWVSWASTQGKQWGPLPPDSWLDEKPWVFLDVNGKEVRESRRFYMERANLDVRYDIDAPARPELALPRKLLLAGEQSAAGGASPNSDAAAAMNPAMLAVMFNVIELAADNAPIDVTPNAAVTREVGEQPVRAGHHHHAVSPGGSGNEEMQNARPEILSGGSAPPSPPMVGSAAPPPRQGIAAPLSAPQPNATRVLLELSDISFTRAPSSGFGVYLSTPDNPQGALAGLIDLFGVTHRDVAGMGGMTATQRFDVTRIVRQSRGPFTIRVAPYDLLVSKSGAAPRKRDDGIRIGSVRFVAVS